MSFQIESILKVVQGWVKIRGGTDGTKIGNIGDALKTVNDTTATSLKIYNLSAPSAATEYSQALTANVKQVMIRARGNTRLQLSFITGQTNTNFFTIPSGTTLTLDSSKIASLTLYLQSSNASQVVEILEFS